MFDRSEKQSADSNLPLYPGLPPSSPSKPAPSCKAVSTALKELLKAPRVASTTKDSKLSIADFNAEDSWMRCRCGEMWSWERLGGEEWCGPTWMHKNLEHVEHQVILCNS